ncbi:MAG: hypothetical protein R3Y08_06850, partial [Rikenellaceae bacterium]
MRKYIYYTLLLLLSESCIENNIPYPVVELYITNIEGEGFTMNEPNNLERTIVLELDESTPINQVEFSKVSYFPDRDITTSVDLNNTFDLRRNLTVTLSLYQDYTWTISANQNVERYFKVENQIGAETIDYSTRSATAYVSESTDLNNIKVTDLKLGPKDVTTYDIALDDLNSFSNYRVVNINYHGDRKRA